MNGPLFAPRSGIGSTELLALAALALLVLAGCSIDFGSGDPASPPDPAAEAPLITTAPQDTRVQEGEPACFEISATGPGLTYRWQVAGQDVDHAAGSTFTLPHAALAHDGATVTVIVSNATGSVQASARLEVVAKPVAARMRRLSLPAADPVPQVAGSDAHTLALMADGSVFAWGDNAFGQLGNGSTAASRVPLAVRARAGMPLRDIAAIAAGSRRSLALRRDGHVLAWGCNPNGDLGDGSGANQAFPVPVLADAQGTPLAGVVAIAAGFSHAVALRQDGTVVAWGERALRQLGNPAATGRLPASVVGPDGRPVGNVVALSAGANHALALRADGTVLSWGDNTAGQLGDGTLDRREFAAPVKDARGDDLAGIRALGVGLLASYVVQSDGGLLAWGQNADGQLGNGTQAGSPWPVAVVDTQGQPLTRIRAVSAGSFHALALDAWGYNGFLQLGTAEAVLLRLRAAPVQSAEGLGLQGIQAMGSGGLYTSFAIDASGHLLVWGINDGGRLGDGSHVDRRLPVRVRLPG